MTRFLISTWLHPTLVKKARKRYSISFKNCRSRNTIKSNLAFVTYLAPKASRKLMRTTHASSSESLNRLIWEQAHTLEINWLLDVNEVNSVKRNVCSFGETTEIWDLSLKGLDPWSSWHITWKTENLKISYWKCNAKEQAGCYATLRSETELTVTAASNQWDFLNP